MTRNAHKGFRERLKAGEPMIGIFVKTPSLIIAELLGLMSLELSAADRLTST